MGTKHFPESNAPVNVNLTGGGGEGEQVAESKTLPSNQNTFGFWDMFWIPGIVFGFWHVVWILGRFFDSGTSFGFQGLFLDSGTCFGFWEVF